MPFDAASGKVKSGACLRQWPSPPRLAIPFSPMRQLLLSSLALFTSAVLLPAQTPPVTGKQVPPPGVPIPEADRQTLEAGVRELASEIRKIPRARATVTAPDGLLPDVEIFLKAVDWPLRYHEFFDLKQVGTAKALLAEGMARARALEAGKAPWTEATGPVVRGYRSRIDGSAQPYGMVVPGTWKAGDQRERHLYVFNHGRGETTTELAFIGGAMKSKGEFSPEDTFVVHPYGRFCNATKFAGETDVFESIAHASASYPIDANRVAMTGFSMGGASVWHLAAHHAWRWAAASPGAGFSDTPIYSKALDPSKEAPPWYEQKLWHLYNATDVVANLQNTHLIAYSGEIDPQKASADLMEKVAAEAGFKLERLIGPKTAHKYEPETKKELQRRLEEYLAKGRPAVLPKVHLVTYTLQYNRQGWVVVDALEEHWKRAEVTAEIESGVIKATTSNVSALTFLLPRGSSNPPAPRVTLDGQNVVATVSSIASEPSLSFHKVNGKWAVPEPVTKTAGEFAKRPGLQGPIDHAFMESFVFVRPTGKSLNPAVDAWVKAEMARAIPQWRTIFRGDARVVDDTAVTPEMVANSNLVLWGDPSSNQVLGKVLGKLPLKWTGDSLVAGGQSYPSAHHVPILIYPNPLNPKHYVVVNSSFTFRQGASMSNALQTPSLPDWAIVDLRTPPTAKWPGLIANAGFFDEAWQFKRDEKHEP